MSETARYRHITAEYCHGNGVDAGSAGSPIVPTAVQVELHHPYCPYLEHQYPPQLKGDATNLYWFRDRVFDYVYSSHLLEDFADWEPVLREWHRVLKVGGHLVIIIPDKARWTEALQRGQPPNLAHKHEGRPGELTEHMERIGRYEVVRDGLADEANPLDYSIIFVGRKLA